MLRVGKIVATHGLQGSVILKHILGKSDWLKKEDVLFLEINKGSFIPFFIQQVKASNDDEFIINFEETTNVESSKKLIGKKVYAKEENLVAHTNDSPLLWIGFKIIDKEKGAIGVIDDVLQTGHQWLAKIMYNGKEVLLPLIEPMIIDINIRNKFIRMDLPEGLLEL